MTQPTYRKKLIEVALPLEAINKESAREKSIRHGHPSTLHLWWARRPLAACRAVLFASLVDDPSSRPDLFPSFEEQEEERQRLFRLIEDLVKWENSSNETVLAAAHAEILKSTNGNPPPVLDPFAGGGSIPLEAQRLGLEAHASDLNPVAVLINKALIEIPPKFAGRAPVNPTYRAKALPSDTWKGAKGLAEDVRFYGQWMRDRAEERIGHLYPKAKPPAGGEATVIAWLWARTVTCPNPACGCRMPLVRSWVVSSKPGKEHFVQPVVDRTSKPPMVTFTVQKGKHKDEGTVGRRGAHCIACKTPVSLDHIRTEGRSGRMHQQLMTVVAEGTRERIYLEASDEHVEIAKSANPTWKPDAELPHNPRDFKTPNYGLRTFADLFTPRQLEALTTFSDLVLEARQRVFEDALGSGMLEGSRLEDGGCDAQAYADAVAVYLGLGVSKLSDATSALTRWKPTMDQAIATFARQAIPMVWDFAESNVFNGAAGDYKTTLGNMLRVLENLCEETPGFASQKNAIEVERSNSLKVISTDPPYYDNIGYADLSDYFYVWMRRSLVSVYPKILSTLLVPKTAELVATPYRFDGSKAKAQTFFETGLGQAFSRMRESAHPDFPVTIYYAFKQSESEDAGHDDGLEQSTASTGWETMLEGLLRSGFQITGTWPMRSELANRMIASGANALASSIVLVCRPRPDTAPNATRREFLSGLRQELPQALRELQLGSIAPVDLAQAAIGPGMAVFSRYARVLETDGQPMRVRSALALINQTLDEVLAEQEGEFDADTRWALAWFDQFGMNEGAFGDAETLSKAKNTSVSGMVEAGILHARAGKVRLLKRDELPEGWNPNQDTNLPVWEATQHLIRALEKGGEMAAARLLVALGSTAEIARDLAYRLYNVCERKRWASEALSYNALVTAWPELQRISSSISVPTMVQDRLV